MNLNPDKDTAADSLGYCLQALLRAPREYAHAIESFIATQDLAGSPTAQAIAATLDRLAILMDVKSDAEDEAGHDLGAALEAFPKLDALPPGDAWWSIRPALERALPPSVLRLNPAWASKRAKTAFRGTWYASRPFSPQPRVGQQARQDRVLASAPRGPASAPRPRGPARSIRPGAPARYLVLGPLFSQSLAHPVLVLAILEALPVRQRALPEHGSELLRQVVRGPVRLAVVQ